METRWVEMQMRFFLGLLLCASLSAADVSQLRQLEKNDRIFELRRTLAQEQSSDAEIRFYRATIKARFGHEAEAIPGLQEFVAGHPDPQIERWAYEELASALERLGRYEEAAQAWAGALRFTPKNDFDREDTENTRALDERLRDVPPETVQISADSTVQAKRNGIGSWNVPVDVNGVEGEWIFDTGANISTIIESEARRMGLTIRETGAYVRGSTGAKNPLRIAVADNLRFGTAQFSHVVFLVLKDEALNITPFKYQIQGILGLPVIRELGRVKISAKGAIQIEGQQPAGQGKPNLFFDELAVIVEARHNEHAVQLLLDTGANETVLYPSFRNALSQQELAKLAKRREKSAGAGGTIQRKTEVIPVLGLDLLGHPDEIQKITLLAKQPKGNAGQREGVLGMDALSRDFTVDFRSMQLQLE